MALLPNTLKTRARKAVRDSPGHQKSPPTVQLPDDILFIIAYHLSLTDRARLLQTCRHFRSLLEATQYRHLRINVRSLYDRSGLLHRTLSERPDLIRCIVSYCGPLTGIAHAPATESFRRAINIFTNAVNLRELQFLNAHDWISNPIWEPVTTSLSRMSLTRLALLITSEAAEVVPLLRALPELEGLELSCVPARLGDLNAGDIPKLKSLTATLQDAATIIPGRPVGEFRHVVGRGELAADEQLVRKLSLSSSPITKLTTTCLQYNKVQSILRVFALHLPEIQHLTLTVCGPVPGQILLDEIPSFRSLRSVRFLDDNLRLVRDQIHTASIVFFGSGNNTDPQSPMGEDWDVLAQGLRTKCPSLVDIEHTRY